MSSVDPIVQAYEDADSFDLPYRCKGFDFVLEEIKGNCPVCKMEVDNIRGQLNEYEKCLEVIAYGVCRNCNLVVKLHPTRYYEDGRIIYKHEGYGWIEGERKFSFGSKVILLLRWLRKLMVGK